ncbi:uncharacterized protein LOC112523646 [Cynara cardunculus var. scolymus]|uniref:uncharacterized protein LOC112523646 n=1 Tax=Cynara cardunculus var. scolymus TaxID=59895 RepID=UPI000D627D11|nr:uncharacterized protein LOC112523646 [Cynara cardunculus var. scolymus]
MEDTIPKPPASSTSATTLQPSPSHLLQINLISAEDLPRISKSMKTYAVAWLNPNRKLTTQVDPKGHVNPYWNEKLSFRLDEEQLYSENSFLTVEIYTVSWFRDILAGIVKIPLIDLISPSMERNRFVTLQVRRPTGEPHGILNMGFCLGESTDKNLPSRENGGENEEEEDDEEAKERKIQIQEKIQLWRSRTVEDLDDDDDDDDEDDGSMVNPAGSIVYGSEVCSDVGPSASVVAAELAKEHRRPVMQRPVPSMSVAMPPREENRSNVDGDDLASSILEELTMEEAVARGWMDGFPSKRREVTRRKHNRRHSDGDGAFTCFGTVYGIEVKIVCGNRQINDSPRKGHNKNRRTSADAKPHAKP